MSLSLSPSLSLSLSLSLSIYIYPPSNPQLGGSEHGFYRQLCCDASNPDADCANASIVWILSMIGQAVSMSAFVVACAYSMLVPGTVQVGLREEYITDHRPVFLLEK